MEENSQGMQATVCVACKFSQRQVPMDQSGFIFFLSLAYGRSKSEHWCKYVA